MGIKLKELDGKIRGLTRTPVYIVCSAVLAVLLKLLPF